MYYNKINDEIVQISSLFKSIFKKEYCIYTKVYFAVKFIFRCKFQQYFFFLNKVP